MHPTDRKPLAGDLKVAQQQLKKFRKTARYVSLYRDQQREKKAEEFQKVDRFQGSAMGGVQKQRSGMPEGKKEKKDGKGVLPASGPEDF